MLLLMDELLWKKQLEVLAEAFRVAHGGGDTGSAGNQSDLRAQGERE